MWPVRDGGQQPFDFKWQSFDRPLAFSGFEF